MRHQQVRVFRAYVVPATGAPVEETVLSGFLQLLHRLPYLEEVGAQPFPVDERVRDLLPSCVPVFRCLLFGEQAGACTQEFPHVAEVGHLQQVVFFLPHVYEMLRGHCHFRLIQVHNRFIYQLMVGTGDFIPQAPKGPRPGSAGFFGEIPEPWARMICPKTACGLTLLCRQRVRATFACGMESAVLISFSIVLTHYSLASPADVYLAFAVALPYQQALDDGHGDIELLEDLRLFLHLARLDELVEPLFGKYQRHQVLLHGVLIGDIMHVLQLFGVEANETEVELFHLRDVPLERFEYHVVAGGYVHGTAQALLRADQYAIDGGVELRHDALPSLERHVALDHEHRTVRETFAEMLLVKVECGYGRAADGHLAGYLPHQPLDVPCLAWNPVAGIALYQVWDGAGLDEQLDLPHKPEAGIFLRVSRAVVIQLADAAELLDDGTVDLALAVGRADGMCPYLVFLAGEVPEFAGDDGLADQLGQFLLVIDILVLLLYAEHGGFSRAVAGAEKHMPPEGGERFAVIRVVLFLYLLVLVLVVYPAAPANHIDGVVVKQLELAVQLGDVVPGSRTRVEYLVLKPAEEA